MLLSTLSKALALKTPTKASLGPGNKPNTFEATALECIENFLECTDLAVVFEVRNEVEELCAKVLRSTKHKSGLEPDQHTHSALLSSVAACRLRIKLCCEFYELKNVVLVAVEQELENLMDLLFQITEHKLSPNSRSRPNIGQLYDKIKCRIDPLSASTKFLPLRIECYSVSAMPQFHDSVLLLKSELLKLEKRIRMFMEEFSNLDRLLKPEWWDPVLQVVSDRPLSKQPPSLDSSSIPVYMRLRGQRGGAPAPAPAPAPAHTPAPRARAPFVSRIPRPTELPIKPRPPSFSGLPRGHTRTSSQWSNSSTISQDSIPSPTEPAFGYLQPRPRSRLFKPTPVDLPRIRGKENDLTEPYLTTITESPNRMGSIIPKFSGSPAVRKRRLGPIR